MLLQGRSNKNVHRCALNNRATIETALRFHCGAYDSEMEIAPGGGRWATAFAATDAVASTVSRKLSMGRRAQCFDVGTFGSDSESRIPVVCRRQENHRLETRGPVLSGLVRRGAGAQRLFILGIYTPFSVRRHVST